MLAAPGIAAASKASSDAPARRQLTGGEVLVPPGRWSMARLRGDMGHRFRSVTRSGHRRRIHHAAVIGVHAAVGSGWRYRRVGVGEGPLRIFVDRAAGCGRELTVLLVLLAKVGAIRMVPVVCVVAVVVIWVQAMLPLLQEPPQVIAPPLVATSVMVPPLPMTAAVSTPFPGRPTRPWPRAACCYLPYRRPARTKSRRSS